MAEPSTNAVPSTGCPANGSSEVGVKIRTVAWASSPPGNTNTVSDRFISRASRCIISSLIPRASVNTAT